jgi:CDP-glucose 4,6-dehydratase
MESKFWKGKKVFITGHTGFKGAWLSTWLKNCGSDVAGFALPPNTQPNLFEVAGVAEGMHSINGDVRDLKKLTKCMVDFSPEVVIHMAAQSLVRRSYKDPVETYSTNVMGTVNLLEAVRKTVSVKVVINVTTDKCYENKEWVWGYREDDPMGGHDPYSNSKGCSELITRSYRNSFFNYPGAAQIATVRAGNVIGGGDWADERLIPDILKSFAKKKLAVIRNPSAVRPWQHVLEPLSGYLKLSELLYTHGVEYAGGWNFGPNDSDVKSVSVIVEYLVKRWGGGVGWIHDTSQQPHEAQLLKLDTSKARSNLNWSPKWNLYTSLDRIIEWQKDWLSDGDMKAMTLKQISDYGTYKGSV